MQHAHQESILVLPFKNPSRILGTSESTGGEWDKYLHRLFSYRIPPSLKSSILQFVANEFQTRAPCFGLLRHRLFSTYSLDPDPGRGDPHINKPVFPLHSIRSRRLLPRIARLELWPCVSVLFYLQHCPDHMQPLAMPYQVSFPPSSEEMGKMYQFVSRALRKASGYVNLQAPCRLRWILAC